MILEYDNDLEVVNLPNGILIKEVGADQFIFVPDISWDKDNSRFVNLTKRRPVLNQKR